LIRLIQENSNPKLVSTANVIKDFQNPKISAEILQKMTVWHGSPYNFNAFDNSKMGTGEGAQAHGWGTYVAKDTDTGTKYAKKFKAAKKSLAYKGKAFDDYVTLPGGSVINSPLSAAYYAIMQEGTVSKAKQFIERIKSMAEDVEMQQHWDNVISILNNSKKSDFTGSAILYEVEIPDDNGSNYLTEGTTIPKKNRRRVADVVRNMDDNLLQREKHGPNWLPNGLETLANVIENGQLDAAEIRARLVDAFGSEKMASQIMSDAGFVGIKYNGVTDGECYVIFNESDAKIINHIQFLKTPNGEVYGFTKDGKVYLDPTLMNPNTPIHEYTHLWATAVENRNPKLWENIISLLKGTDVWNEVLNDEAYQDIAGNDSLVASEVLARMTGKEGAKRLTDMADEALKEPDMTDRARKMSIVNRIKEALDKFWNFVARDIFHIDSFNRAEDIPMQVLYDLVNRTNLDGGGNNGGKPTFRITNGEASSVDKVKADVDSYLQPDRLNMVEDTKRRIHANINEQIEYFAANMDDIRRSEMAFEKGLSGAFYTYYDGTNFIDNDNVPERVKDAFADAEYVYGDMRNILTQNRKDKQEEFDSLNDEINNGILYDSTPKLYEQTKKELEDIDKALFWIKAHENDVTLAPVEFFDEDGKYVGPDNVSAYKAATRPSFRITPAQDKAYMDAVNAGDMETAQRMVDEAADGYINNQLLPNDDDIAGFKYHRGPAPTKTFKRYAVLNVNPDGFKAAYAGNKDATPVGVLLDAQNLKSYTSDLVQFKDGTFATYIPGDTGASTSSKFSPLLMDEMAKEGVPRSSKWLLERGGKHSSDIPNFSQMNLMQNENGEKVENKLKDGALPHNKLIFEIEYGITEGGDLTEFVKENGRIDATGKNQGIAKIQPNQYYDFKTNANAVGNWGIGGTFKILRLVPHDEIVRVTNEYKKNSIAEAEKAYKDGEISKADHDKRIKNANAIQVQKWVGGYHPEDFGLSVESVDEMRKQGEQKKLTDPVTYDDNGNVIPLSQRFNPKVNDIRFRITPSEDKAYMEAAKSGDTK
ncbi:MAG: hypothetical protein HUJ98_04070, partial [Bacteroidaceae bacterium]|nr:hypothetical protein [Bacteroidaceae bacterium]